MNKRIRIIVKLTLGFLVFIGINLMLYSESVMKLEDLHFAFAGISIFFCTGFYSLLLGLTLGEGMTMELAYLSNLEVVRVVFLSEKPGGTYVVLERGSEEIVTTFIDKETAKELECDKLYIFKDGRLVKMDT